MARRAKQSRPRQGARLVELRQAARLTQQELADLLQEPQSNIAFWEHSEKPPRSDVLARMAKAFGVGVEDILNVNGGTSSPARKSAPSGRVARLFDEVSRLPRRQQDKVVEFVSAFVRQYREE